MSNVIKSGFVAFSNDNMLVIDSNQLMRQMDGGRVIRSIEEQQDTLDDLELEDILSEDAYQQELTEGQRLADSILADARVKAEQILADANTQAQTIAERARQDGYQAGYTSGQKKAEEEAETKLQTQLDAMQAEQQRLEKALVAEKELFLYEAEPKMAEVAISLIRSLIGIAVDGQKDVLVYMIDRAMRDIEDSMHFVIKVSEEDFEAVAANKQRIYGSNNPAIQIDVMADAKLSENQCLIETDNGIINCSLDEQLCNLERDIRMLAAKN